VDDARRPPREGRWVAFRRRGGASRTAAVGVGIARAMWTHSTFCRIGPGGLPAKWSVRGRGRRACGALFPRSCRPSYVRQPSTRPRGTTRSCRSMRRAAERLNLDRRHFSPQEQAEIAAARRVDVQALREQGMSTYAIAEKVGVTRLL